MRRVARVIARSVVALALLALLAGCDRPADPGSSQETTTSAQQTIGASTPGSAAAVTVSRAATRVTDDQSSGIIELLALERTGAFITAGPVRHGEATIVGDAAGRLTATDPDGAAWQIDLRDPILSIAVSPARVYVATAATIAALSPGSGGRLWERRLDTAATTGIAESPSIVAAGLGSGVIAAWDAESGRDRWATDLARVARDPLIIADGRVFVVTDDGTVHALALADGSVEWSVPIDTEPAVALGGAVYRDGRIAAGSADGRVVVVDLSGNVVLRHGRAGSQGGAAVTDGTSFAPLLGRRSVITVSGAGSVVARDLDGDQRGGGAAALWTREMSGPVYGTPFVRGEYLILGQSDGIVALSIADGSPRSRLIVDAAPLDAGHVIGQELIVALNDGSLLRANLDGSANDPPLFTAGRVWRLPPEGVFRLTDGEVAIRMSVARDAAFEVIVDTVPDEEVIFSVSDPAGTVIATNMEHVDLASSLRVALRAGLTYTLRIRRITPVGTVSVQVTPRRID
ncbi:MAG: hypothetical protein EA382_02530 [Spirochaetaceae bacterium]|nr:MAG: hypothetical protein EA382_02530 [Spirochaetaceae bacterium]